MKNSRRILAGLAVLLGGVGRADCVITDLGTFGGTQSSATAINSFEQVVGVASFPGDAISHAFLYSNGVKQDLGSLGGGAYSIAAALNISGQVVGTANVTTLGPQHAFL